MNLTGGNLKQFLTVLLCMTKLESTCCIEQSANMKDTFQGLDMLPVQMVIVLTRETRLHWSLKKNMNDTE